MVRKFLEYDETENSAEDKWHRVPFERCYCFFYGTLMDAITLSQVLRLSRPISAMRRAKVIGYETKF